MSRDARGRRSFRRNNRLRRNADGILRMHGCHRRCHKILYRGRHRFPACCGWVVRWLGTHMRIPLVSVCTLLFGAPILLTTLGLAIYAASNVSSSESVLLMMVRYMPLAPPSPSSPILSKPPTLPPRIPLLSPPSSPPSPPPPPPPSPKSPPPSPPRGNSSDPPPRPPATPPLIDILQRHPAPSGALRRSPAHLRHLRHQRFPRMPCLSCLVCRRISSLNIFLQLFELTSITAHCSVHMPKHPKRGGGPI